MQTHVANAATINSARCATVGKLKAAFASGEPGLYGAETVAVIVPVAMAVMDG